MNAQDLPNPGGLIIRRNFGQKILIEIPGHKPVEITCVNHTSRLHFVAEPEIKILRGEIAIERQVACGNSK